MKTNPSSEWTRRAYTILTVKATPPNFLHALAYCKLVGTVNDIPRACHPHIDGQVQYLCLHFAPFICRSCNLSLLVLIGTAEWAVADTTATAQPVEIAEAPERQRGVAAAMREDTMGKAKAAATIGKNHHDGE